MNFDRAIRLRQFISPHSFLFGGRGPEEEKMVLLKMLNKGIQMPQVSLVREFSFPQMIRLKGIIRPLPITSSDVFFEVKSNEKSLGRYSFYDKKSILEPYQKLMKNSCYQGVEIQFMNEALKVENNVSTKFNVFDYHPIIQGEAFTFKKEFLRPMSSLISEHQTYIKDRTWQIYNSFFNKNHVNAAYLIPYGGYISEKCHLHEIEQVFATIETFSTHCKLSLYGAQEVKGKGIVHSDQPIDAEGRTWYLHPQSVESMSSLEEDIQRGCIPLTLTCPFTQTTQAYHSIASTQNASHEVEITFIQISVH